MATAPGAPPPGSRRHPISPRLRGCDGSSVAGLVVLFPLVLFMVFALVQWGLHYHAEAIVSAAAADATREAQAYGATPADGELVAQQLLEGAQGSGLITVTDLGITEDAGLVTTIVAAEVVRVIPIPGIDFRVAATVVGPKEALR